MYRYTNNACLSMFNYTNVGSKTHIYLKQLLIIESAGIHTQLKSANTGRYPSRPNTTAIWIKLAWRGLFLRRQRFPEAAVLAPPL